MLLASIREQTDVPEWTLFRGLARRGPAVMATEYDENPSDTGLSPEMEDTGFKDGEPGR
jgi:hypothetical protein